MDEQSNIVLIGMPGVGKSTVGVLLAKAMSRSFMDTDVRIQSREGRPLQEMLDAEGPARFCEVEERYVLSLQCRACVIATGGSVVYSPAAMAHLKASGVVVHLDLPFASLEERLADLGARGVVMASGQTLGGLFEERQPLYRQYADLTIKCEGLDHEQVVARIAQALAAELTRPPTRSEDP